METDNYRMSRWTRMPKVEEKPGREATWGLLLSLKRSNKNINPEYPTLSYCVGIALKTLAGANLYCVAWGPMSESVICSFLGNRVWRPSPGFKTPS